MQIVILLFEQVTVIDAIGPYDVLRSLPGASVTFAGLERGIVRAEGGLGLLVERELSEVASADVLLVPGGIGTRRLLGDARVRDFILNVDRTTRVTASVCTGALLLGVAGLLAGRRANTHFAVRERLAQYGATPSDARVTRDGKYMTSAGATAGIDLALALAAELSGPRVAQAIQLGLEYAPEPPFDTGRPERAPSELREAVIARTLAAERRILGATAP